MASKHRMPNRQDEGLQRIFAALIAAVVFAALVSSAVVYFFGSSVSRTPARPLLRPRRCRSVSRAPW
jgi:hypothetical protein